VFTEEVRKGLVSRMRDYWNWQWHPEEMFVKIHGELPYLWRAVDQEGDATVSQDAKFAGVRRRPRFGPQPFQPGTPPLLPTVLQAQPRDRSRRVAPSLFSMSSGSSAIIWTGWKRSDSTVKRADSATPQIRTNRPFNS
jgi:hypothetical protein